jgi:hypothetical protein
MRSPTGARMGPLGLLGPLRRRVAAGLTVVAAGGVVLVAASTAVSGQDPDQVPEAITQLEAEIGAMRAGGMAADDPKVELLQDEVDALREGMDAQPERDPGLSSGPGASGAQSSTPEDAARTAESAGAGGGAESAEVECEPIPHALEADDLVDAVCASVPQPDGTARYVAVVPTGAVHVVRFGGDGAAERQPDQALPLGAASASSEALTLVPNADGDVVVEADGAELATLDLR